MRRCCIFFRSFVYLNNFTFNKKAQFIEYVIWNYQCVHVLANSIRLRSVDGCVRKLLWVWSNVNLHDYACLMETKISLSGRRFRYRRHRHAHTDGQAYVCMHVRYHFANAEKFQKNKDEHLSFQTISRSFFLFLSLACSEIHAIERIA